MAFLIPTNAVQIARFANGLYGVQLGFASTNGIVSDVGGAGLIPTFNNYYSLSFGAMTTAAVAQIVITNLGIVANTGGLSANAVSAALAYVTAQLNAAAPAARGAAVKAVFDMWSSISADAVNGPIYGTTAASWNSQISKAVQYAGAVNPDITVAAAILLPVAPNTVTLSTGPDTVAGSASSPNIINGIFGTGTTTTLTSGDSIGLSGTSNSIFLSDNTSTGTTTVTPTGIAALTVNGVQSATFTSAEALTVNTASTAAGNQGWAGLTSLTVTDSGTNSTPAASGVTAITALGTTNVTLFETGSNGNTTSIQGGNNVSASITGTLANGAITVGATATPPAGTSTVSQTISATAASITLATVTAVGGTAISITNASSLPTTTTTQNQVNTAGVVTVTGTAATKSVVIVQPIPVAAVETATWLAMTSAASASQTVGGATVTGNATAASYTAAQVAAVAAGATIPGLTLTPSTTFGTFASGTPTFTANFGIPSATNGTVMTSVITAGAVQTFAVGTANAAQGITLVPTLSGNAGGIYDAPVTVNDVSQTSATATGTITSISISGLSLNAIAANQTAGSATINANALANTGSAGLTIANNSLSASTVTLTNNLTTQAVGAGTLNLQLTGDSQTVTFVDTNAELTGLAITLGNTGTSLVNSLTVSTATAANLTSLTVTSTVPSTLLFNLGASSATSVTAAKLAALTISGSAGISANVSGITTLTTITSNSSGTTFLAINPATQTYVGTASTGSTDLYITAVASKVQTPSATATTLPQQIVWQGTSIPTTLTTTGGSFAGFNTFAIGALATANGTYNMSTIIPAAGTAFTTIKVQSASNIGLSNVAVGTPVWFNNTTAGTDSISILGTSGATATLPISIGVNATNSLNVASGLSAPTVGIQTITALTLTDSSTGTATVANGIGTLTVSTFAALGGQVETITTLTDSSLSTINVSGGAGLQIGAISGDLATSLTWNNTSTSTQASGLTGATTWSALSAITLTGTAPITLSQINVVGAAIAQSTGNNSVITSTAAGMTITNTNTASTTSAGTVTPTPATVNFTDNTLAVVTFAGTAPITSSIYTTSTSLSVVNNNTFVAASTTAQNVSVSFGDAAAVSSLIISGSGKTFINTGTTSTNGLASTAASFSLTDTNTGAVQVGPTITTLQSGLPFAVNALNQTFIQSGSGTLVVNENMSTANPGGGAGLVTLTAVGGVGLNLQSAVTSALTVTAGSDTAAINLGQSTVQPLASGGTHILTLGTGTNVVFDSNTALNTVNLGTLTSTNTNTYINLGVMATGLPAITVGNGNNTIILGAGNNTVVTQINIGNGNNLISLGSSNTRSADNITINAGQTNGPAFTAFTTIGNIGGTTAANLANTSVSVNSSAPSATSIVNSITLASISGVSVGAVIADNTTAAITAGTVIRSIAGNVVTLSSPLLLQALANDSITIANEATGGRTTDTITWATPALATTIANQTTAPASIAAGVSAAQSAGVGYSAFTFNGNTFIYENTGFASTSELISLVGTHTYTATQAAVTIIT